MRSRAVPLLALLAAAATAGFVALTVAVTHNPSLAFDSRAFTVANDLRAPWLDHVARIVTTFGLIAVVGPGVLIGAAILVRRGERVRAAALVAGAAITWVGWNIAKAAVDRPRPPEPLVHTTSSSFPSGHAANAVAWLALGIALTPLLARRGARIAAIGAGLALTVLVGLSRVYLRAHYLSDVLGGEALAVAIYSLTALAALHWIRAHHSASAR